MNTLQNQLSHVGSNETLSKTLHYITPGVGDYDTEKANIKKKSPICTISNSVRFQRLSSAQRYKVNMPVSYVSNMHEPQKPKMKMGVIGST